MLLNNRSSHQLAIFIFCCVCLLAESRVSQNLTCDLQDLAALKGFLVNLDSGINGWESNSGADHCCTWDGVTCEFVFPISNISRVISLELPRKRLRGKLNKALAGLNYLRVLNLSNNFFHDTLPHELFRFEFLDLSSNAFMGIVTEKINLPSLKFLDLSKNSFTGTIPATIANCSFLEVLSLGLNHFDGNLPEDLFQLLKLRQLTLQNNRFAGMLSPSFSKLSNIVEFDISSNGFFGTIPDTFDNLIKLKQFSASSNRFIGSLPPSLSSSSSISSLNVRNNSLNGSIAINCSSMVSLTSLALGSNALSGPLPENLSSCKHLRYLDLSRFKFDSPLPKSFKNLTSLSHLSLSKCSLQNLTETLKILQHCKNLSFLVLTNNFQDEKMPTSHNLQFNSLETLVLANCRLTGLIPNWLQSCSNLHLLDLSWNQLSGPIPDIFSKMKYLFYLDFSRNMLSEGIPKGLTELQSLINQITIPEEQSEDLSLFYKGRTASGLKYNHIHSFPPSLDLSSNYLTGPIPEELGNLKQLHVLNLKNNILTGHIPETLSNLTNLEILNLSNNSLSGTIPPSFAKLSFLSDFSVAFNKLSGYVPTGGQFLTFPRSSFAGNEDLCGYESSPCLSGAKPRKNSIRSEDGDDSIIGLPSAIGGVAGFLFIVIMCYLSGWLAPKKEAKERIEIAWRRIR